MLARNAHENENQIDQISLEGKYVLASEQASTNPEPIKTHTESYMKIMKLQLWLKLLLQFS